MEPPQKSLQEKLDANAFVEQNGIKYHLDLSELESSHWAKDVDSSWFRCALVSAARRQLGEQLGRSLVIQLCAATLRVTVEALEQSLEWNAQYLAWHDNDSPSETHVWPA